MADASPHFLVCGWCLSSPSGAGVLFATSASTAQGTDLRSSASDLPDLIRAQTRQNARAAERVRGLQSEVDQLSAASAPGDLRIKQLTRQANALDGGGGHAARCPALRWSWSSTTPRSPADQLPEGVGVDDIVVHQQDVQAVVNALWAGGAEAMMVQDQRLISTSAVRCVGNTLILQGRVYSPPYVITAMGNPAALLRALDDQPPGRHLPPVRRRLGLGYDVEDQPRTDLPRLRWLREPRVRHGGPMTNRLVRWVVGGPRRHPRHGWPGPPPLRRLAAVVDRRRGQPRPGRHGAGAHPRLRPGRPGRERPRTGSTGADAVRRRPSRSCASRASGPTTRGRSSRARTTRPCRRAWATTTAPPRPGADRQLGARRAPHDLRPPVPRHRPAASRATGSSSRPSPATPCMPWTATRSWPPPPSRSSRRCPSKPGARPNAACLTLTACHPKYSAAQRYVVFARLVRTYPRAGGLPAGALQVPGKKA